MGLFARLIAFFALSIATASSVTAAADVAADYEGPDGYGNTGTTYELDVSHDGYAREGQVSEEADPTTYVVVETEEGTTEQIDGETVIVVEEPEPIAATREAPPPPKTVVVEEQIPTCPGGIWVDGYWYYSNGEYLWVDGHCVVERVNYVFVHPRWDFYANIWWFVPGYYRPYGVYVGFGYFRPWHWYPPFFHPFYPARHPVPVQRSVPRRPTTVHPTPARPAPASRTPSRGVVSRPSDAPGRATTVERRPPTTIGRTGSVGRVGVPPTRRTYLTGAPTPRTTVIYRTPTGATRAGTLGRAATGPTLTSTVPRVRSGSTIVTRPRVNPGRTRNVRRSPSAPSGRWSPGGSGTSPSRSGSGRRPSAAPSRGSSVGRGWTAPARGGFGPSRGAPSGRSR